VKLLIAMRSGCALMLFPALIVLHGCASYESRLMADQLTVDKISSGQASIGAIYVHKSTAGIDIAGKVELKRAMIGDPPGHMLVTVIDPDGKVLYTARTRYYRYGKPIKESAIFNFSLTIPLSPPKGSILRLMDEAPLRKSSSEDRRKFAGSANFGCCHFDWL
jgi:hypothetical protein